MNSKLDLVVVIPESEEGRRSFDRLVKAAEDLFSQQGYRSTTIKDIAQKRRTVRGGVLHLFPQ